MLFYRPNTLCPEWELRGLPPKHLKEQISETIALNSVKFSTLTTHWLLYTFAKFYIKGVIVVEVMEKINAVSPLYGHGVIIDLVTKANIDCYAENR